jgi:hypothetical protein
MILILWDNTEVSRDCDQVSTTLFCLMRLAATQGAIEMEGQ